MKSFGPLRLGVLDHARVEACARLMAGSEPWITLGRTVAGAIAIFEDPAKETYFLEDRDGIAAVLILDMRGALSGYIQSLAVRPDLRGKGLGSGIVRWAEDRIYAESPNVFLCVSSFNPDALRFYKRLGYEVVGTLKAFIIPEHDEILLRKSRGSWAEFRGPEPGPKEER